MSDVKQAGDPPPEKEPYEPPRLTRLGTLADFTLHVGYSGGDGAIGVFSP
jgi:hypothetical protein